MTQQIKSHLDPSRTTPLGILRFAIEFYAAAIATNDALGDSTGGGEATAAPITVNYLLGHAMELGFKAYLMHRGVRLDHIKSEIGHRLVRARNAANGLGLGDHFQSANDTSGLLEALDVLYANKQFEYIETGFKQFPDFNQLQAYAAGLLHTVANVIPTGSALRRARSKPGAILMRTLA